jgi:hypothetical protein
MSLQEAIEDLRARVVRLEARQKTTRGRMNMRKAADYLGRSREWLRRKHLAGEGPHRAADGTYSPDDLDAYAEALRSE